MSSISIDSGIFRNTISKEQTLKDLVKTIPNNRVLYNIELDGKEFQYSDDLDLLATTIGLYQTINFVTKTRLELIYDSLDSCSSYIDHLTASIKKTTTLYQNEELELANSNFSICVDGIDLFIELISKINQGLKSEKPHLFQKGQSTIDLEIHLLSVLKALLPAKEKNDIVMLCDLLEYELIDNLTQWKIKVIPELKKIGEN